MFPIRLWWKPFDKILINLSVTKSNWYSYNKKDGNKDIRIISVEKTIDTGSSMSAYRFCLGPCKIIIGW